MLPVGTLVDTIHAAEISTVADLYQLIDDVAIGRLRFALAGARCFWCGEAVDDPYAICALRETILKPDTSGRIRVLWPLLKTTFHTRLALITPLPVVDLTLLAEEAQVPRTYLRQTDVDALRESSRLAGSVLTGETAGIVWESLRARPYKALAVSHGEQAPATVWSIVESGPVVENERVMRTIRNAAAEGGDALG